MSSSSQIGPSSGNGGKGGGRGGEEGGGKEKEEEKAKRAAENDADNENGEEGEATSDSGADSDEFSDVVVLDPLGREEERPSKQQPNSPQKEAAQQPKSPQANPSNPQQQSPQIPQPRIPEMDPSPVYPNLEHSAHQQHGPHSQQQSWFSSSQLPSFLAKSANEAEDGSQTSASASMFRIFGELRARLQPWGEFFRPAKFGLPPGLVAIGPRIKHNLGHFLSNYLCLFVVLLIYCILTSLLMLLTLIVLAGLCYTIYQRTQKGPIILGGQEIPASLLYTLALMVCIPLFYMANAGSVMYWVIGTGLFLMLAHAIFYASEEVPGQEFEVVSVVTA